MNSFLSVLYFQTNSYSGEKLAGGLLVVGPSKIWFGHSEAKMKLVSQLSSDNEQKLLAQMLKEIEQKASDVNFGLETKGILSAQPHLFTENYLQYLNKYSQGVLQFGALLPVAGQIDEAGFEDLFAQFVGREKLKSVKTKKPLPAQLQRKGLTDKADVNYVLKPGPQFQGIYMDTTLSLVTKNGALKAYQLIDFTEEKSKVLHKVEEFTLAAFALERFSNAKKWGEKPVFEILFATKVQPETVAAEELTHPNKVNELFTHVKSYKPDLIALEDDSKLESVVAVIMNGPHIPLSTIINGAA